MAFKEIDIRPLTGQFNAQSAPSEIGFGNFRLVKNACMRGLNRRQRAGGFVRFMHDAPEYNNQDFHDQLINQQYYRETLSAIFQTGGDFTGWQFNVPGTYVASSIDFALYDAYYCGAGLQYEYGYDGVEWGWDYALDVEFPVTLGLGWFAWNWSAGYPYSAKQPFYDPMCNTGFPDYWQSTFYELGFGALIPAYVEGAYGYGEAYYSPITYYDQDYCGNELFLWPGCREPITLIEQAETADLRVMVVGTKSRLAVLNEDSGNWKLLVDTQGGPYDPEQCGCYPRRWHSAVMGKWMMFTNGFDQPLLWLVGDPPQGCERWRALPVADLQAFGITAAGGVVSWKGFFLLFDVTIAGVREASSIYWCDMENPLNWIPSDTSLAGFSTVCPGQTILAAGEMGNNLYLYTDTSIWRVTLVGGDQIFNFEEIPTGGNSLKYKYSFVNTKREHIYLSRNNLCMVFTQNDARPVEYDWMSKAAYCIFNGLNEDDAAFGPLNTTQCDFVTGGWNDDTKEVFFSWPTSGFECPNMTLVLNLQYNVAHLVDDGFTAFRTVRGDARPTIFQWLKDISACEQSDFSAETEKEGPGCHDTGGPAATLKYIWNDTEDVDLPMGPDGFCARYGNMSIADFCNDCQDPARFVLASATDFCLKEFRDDHYYREYYVDTYNPLYCAYGCLGGYYICSGYDTVLQSGANDFKRDGEKMINRITAEYVAEPQAIPSNLECDIGYSNQGACLIWKELPPKQLKCITDMNEAEHDAARTRPDRRAHFPTWRQGKYLAWRLRIRGMGGGCQFAALTQVVDVTEFNVWR